MSEDREGPPKFHIRPVIAGTGNQHGRVLGASGRARVADLKANLHLITEDSQVQQRLTDRMESFAQVVRQLLTEGGAILYSGEKIDFGFRMGLYIPDKSIAARLRAEALVGLHKPIGLDGSKLAAKPWMVLLRPEIASDLDAYLVTQGRHLRFSLVTKPNKTTEERQTQAHVLNEHLIGGALVNYAGILMPRGEFPNRISGSTLAKAAVLDAIPHKP